MRTETLDRMVEILEASSTTTFGAALDRAERELNVIVPERMQAPLLTAAFKIIGGQKIPGLADA